MKKFFAIALAAILLLSIVACSKDGDNTEGEGQATTVVVEDVYTNESGVDSFTYAVNEAGFYEITGFTSTNIAPHKIEIPAKINNIEVTGIATEAFVACNQISEVVIPDSVKYISDCAFTGSKYLTKVTMANSVTEIGAAAFDGCTALVDVTLSSGLEAVSDYTFRNCTALETIVIPASVKTIGDGAFFSAEALKNVTLPEGLETIGDGAFYANKALEKITVPASVVNFGEHVFTSGNENFTIVGADASAAQAYAAAGGYGFELLQPTLQ